MKHTKTMTRYNERGVTLFELLLVVGALASLLAVGSYIVTQVGRQTLFESTARQLLTVQRGAEDFVKANFTQLLDAATAGNIDAPGAVRVLTVEDLAEDNYLTETASDQLAMQLRMRIFLRNDTTAGNPEAIEVITTTEEAVAGDGLPFSDLIDAALYGRGKIGILANVAPYDIANFRSVTNQWTVPLAELTGYPGTLPNGLPATGYLASYGRLSNDDIFDADVLYRIPVAGSPELNRMTTDLNMGGFNLCGRITAAGGCETAESTMTTDRLSAANVTLSGEGGYALSTEGRMEITGDTIIDGDMTVYGDNDAGTADLQTPSLTVANGTVAADTVSGTDMEVGDGGLLAVNVSTDTLGAEELTVNGTMTTNGTIETPAAQLAGTGGATAITATSLESESVVAGTTNVTGTFTANTGAAHTVVDNLRANGAASLGTITADSVQFQDLCYTQGAAEGINGC